MATVRYRADEIPAPTPEEEAHYQALAEAPDEGIDYSDDPKWTEDDFARAVQVQDYPNVGEAERVALHLLALQKAGATHEELEAYRVGQRTARELAAATAVTITRSGDEATAAAVHADGTTRVAITMSKADDAKLAEFALELLGSVKAKQEQMASV